MFLLQLLFMVHLLFAGVPDFSGEKHNTIDGTLSFPEGTEITSAQLLEILDTDELRESEGVDVQRDEEDDVFEIEIAFTGLSEELKVDCRDGDCSLVEGIIQAKLPHASLSEFHTVFSQIPPGRLEFVNPFVNSAETQVGIGPSRLSDMIVAGDSTGDSKKIPVILPQKCDLTRNIGPVRNQGNVGSCAAHSMAHVLEYYEYRDHDHDEPVVMSPKYIYYNRPDEQIKAGGSGMSPTNIGKQVKKSGVVSEKEVPYKGASEGRGLEDIPKKAQEDGAKWANENVKSSKYFCYNSRFNTKEKFIELTKQLLSMCGPLMISVETHRHHDCDIWNKKGTQGRGGHALTAVGYNAQHILIQNSWGETWCDKGRTTMSWDDAFNKAIFCGFAKPIKDLNSYDWDNAKMSEHECGRDHDTCCRGKDFKWNEDWDKLTAGERTHWTTLGYNKIIWDNDSEPEWGGCWDDMNAERRDAAERLCYDKASWNKNECQGKATRKKTLPTDDNCLDENDSVFLGQFDSCRDAILVGIRCDRLLGDGQRVGDICCLSCMQVWNTRKEATVAKVMNVEESAKSSIFNIYAGILALVVFGACAVPQLLKRSSAKNSMFVSLIEDEI